MWHEAEKKSQNAINRGVNTQIIVNLYKGIQLFLLKAI